MGTHFFSRHTTWTVFASLLVALGLGACSDVSNAPAPAAPLSPDAKLSSLTVSPGPLAPTFASDVTTYTVDVAFNVTSITVTAAPQNAGSTMTVNGLPTISGQSQTITLGAVGSSTPIPIVVTAPDKSQNTYVVTVHRAVNTSLKSLTVSPGTLNPGFAVSTTSYSVDVANTDSSVNVTATLQDVTAAMTINGQPTISGQSRSISTGVGVAGSSTLVTIVVQQGSSQTTYFMTVNRAALGGNNNLSALSVTIPPSTTNLIPISSFSASTTNYTVNVGSAVGKVTVSATKSDPNALMSGAVTAGAGVLTGQAEITLSGPGTSKDVSITVTAPNTNSKIYTITVVVAAQNNANLSALEVHPGAMTTLAALTLTPTFSPATTSYTTAQVGNTVTQVTIVATMDNSSAKMTIDGTLSTGQTTVGIGTAGSTTPILIVVTPPSGPADAITYTVNVPIAP